MPVTKRTFDRHASARLTRPFVPLGTPSGSASTAIKRSAPISTNEAAGSRKRQKKNQTQVEVNAASFVVLLWVSYHLFCSQSTSNNEDRDVEPSEDPNSPLREPSPLRAPSPPPREASPPPRPEDPPSQHGSLPRGPPTIVLDNLKIDQAYIDLLKTATLDDSDQDKDALHRIRNPIQEVLHIDNDPDLLLSIKNFLSLTNASDKAYTEIRDNIMSRFPECQMLSHHLVKQKIIDLTGVVSIVNDMCVNSCVAFTGPRADADACSECGESRWDPQRFADSDGVAKVPRKTYHTIPLGPQLQALWRSEKGAKAMRYRAENTAEILRELDANNGVLSQYDDLFSGEDYIRAVKEG
ncbi:hypothetical protein K438DRAFT_1984740 [Mycena galopus ATCC 62051]|nr:hypothetical protein K438DRAFT_1984740 [Mycena galopus ATCC 62051]